MIDTDSLTPKLALVACAGMFALACGLLPGSKTPELARFECQVAAIEPYVGDIFDAVELMRDVYAGKADLSEVAGYLRLTPEKIDAVNAKMRECNGEPQAPPEPEETVQSKLVAPPPAYGNKVL